MAAKIGVIEKAVTTAGTGEQVTTHSIVVRSLVIVPGKDTATNTGTIYIGDSTVDKTAHLHLALASTITSFIFPVPDRGLDLSSMWIDAATTADGARFIYTQ